MLFTKKQPEKREKSFEEMTNPELLEVILSNLEKFSEIPEERLILYFEKELDVGNLLDLFQKLDFENQKYFIQLIPMKKLKYMLKSALKFRNFSFGEEFMRFLSNVVMDENKEEKIKNFQKLGNLMCSDEETISMLFDIFFQMEAEEFLEFYKSSSKIVKIEILERIFADLSNTIESLTWQSNIRFVLQEMKRAGKITFTEQLYLDYANANIME